MALSLVICYLYNSLIYNFLYAMNLLMRRNLWFLWVEIGYDDD